MIYAGDQKQKTVLILPEEGSFVSSLKALVVELPLFISARGPLREPILVKDQL